MPLDVAQFRVLFEAECDRVQRFLMRLCGNSSDADDLAQETFLRIWRHRASFEGRGVAAAWLMKTAFRVYLSAREKRIRRHALGLARPPVASASNGHAAEERESRQHVVERVREAVDGLPDGPREAFLMFRLEGLSIAQVAEITDAPPKTVETRIRRAVSLLAERLGALRLHLPIL